VKKNLKRKFMKEKRLMLLKKMVQNGANTIVSDTKVLPKLKKIF
jgi:hypothetical protein